MTIREAREALNALPEEFDNTELKYDNGFDYEPIHEIRPKYAPDLRRIKPIFFAIL